MIPHILQTFGLNLMLAEMLVGDLSDEQMCAQPHGLINHPAWSLGHLVKSAHDCCSLIGVDSTLPDGWDETFKAGTPPTPDAGASPAKEDLLRELRGVHARLAEALPGVEASALAAPHPIEPVRQYFPTVGDQIVYSMTAHEMDHLGQIAAWRRAMGLEPVM